ncbi:hypothetical protein [Methyloceanibacter sp. wino2]|uniref:hypothetical protein n=1 Tax=Methyloceanibacter sp. wino2 TaxID=2170729 RepID=UPI000D3ED22E|nr:hypothetical protein [Methyloceanibacter sp. wino2]
MSGTSRRRQLLLSTAALAGALTGYGRGAYAQCAPGSGTQFVCSGANIDTQTINADNAAVFTTYGFSVDTTAGGGSGGNAVTISGDGFLAYTDGNASPLTADDTALDIHATGDYAGSGGISVLFDGALQGSSGAVFQNDSSGGQNITANGSVTGTSGSGIYAHNGSLATGITINTAAGPPCPARSAAST